METREGSILCPDSRGWHRLVYREWGPAHGAPVLCVHYFTGNSHYFDALAAALAADGYRVVAPDMPGRGLSDKLANPKDYSTRQYIADLAALIAHLGINQPGRLTWIGASMGGALGIRMTGLPGTPVGRLVLIDVGPVVPIQDIETITARVAQPLAFGTLYQFEKFMSDLRGPAWGPVPEGYWRAMASHGAWALPDGRIAPAYDPAIAEIFAIEARGELWDYWDAVACPVLALRGVNTTLFPQDTADEMIRRNKNMTLAQIDGCGHVPSLAVPAQINVVREWLGSGRAAAAT